MPETTKPDDKGRSAYDIVEAGAGGVFHRATVLYELESAACGVAEEFSYDDEEAASELVRLCREVEEKARLLSIREDGRLTLYRECVRCSGHGGTPGEPVCVLCEGSGRVHADEADG